MDTTQEKELLEKIEAISKEYSAKLQAIQEEEKKLVLALIKDIKES